jgi:hypothetical protein
MALQRLRLNKRTIRNLDVRSGIRTGALTFTKTVDCPPEPPSADCVATVTEGATCGCLKARTGVCNGGNTINGGA